MPVNGTTAIAVQQGKTSSRVQVFQWLDGVIKQDGALSTQGPRTKDSVSDAENRIVEATKLAREKGVDLATTPVQVFWSYPQQDDGKGNFRVGDGGVDGLKPDDTFNPQKRIAEKLAEAGLNKDGVKLQIGNDGVIQLATAIQKYGEKLQPGDTIYHAITGGGTGFVSAKVAANKQVTEVQNKEYGHEPMPAILPNLAVEGLARKNQVDTITQISGAAEPYTSGGNDANPNHGMKATAINVMNYFADKPEFTQAIGAERLDAGNLKDLALNILGVTEDDVKNSPLYQKYTAANNTQILNQDITQAAAAGDVFALAIAKFTAKRIADFMVNAINKDVAAGGSKPKLITINGGLTKGLWQIPAAQEIFKTEVKSRVDADIELMPVEMDGTLDLAKAALA